VETRNQAGADRTVPSITGMTCSGCVSTVTRVLLRVPGVTKAEVNPSRGGGSSKAQPSHRRSSPPPKQPDSAHRLSTNGRNEDNERDRSYC
jgi:cation transport ATPase